MNTNNKTQKSAAIVTENAISVFHDGILYPPITKDHAYFSRIKNCVRLGKWEQIPDLMARLSNKLKNYVSNFSEIDLESGVFKYNGTIVNNLLTTRIVELMKSGNEFQPMLNFLENVQKNPSSRSINELYSFLEHKSLPITEDGCFLAYKAVKRDYKDIYSGTFDNSIGKTPEVPRDSVDSDHEKHCSHGLHVGAIQYVKSYGHFTNNISPDGNRLLIVKVNPMDAVCVPSDCSCTKLRVCKYEVIGEITDLKNILDGLVYTADPSNITESECNFYDGDEFDDEDGDDIFDDLLVDDFDDTSEKSTLTDNDSDYFLGRNQGSLDKKGGKGYSPKFSESKRYMRGYKNGYEKTNK